MITTKGLWGKASVHPRCRLQSPLPDCPPPSPEPPALVTRWLTGVHLLTSLPTPRYGHNPLHLTLTPSPICPLPRPAQGQVPGTRDTLCSSDPNRMIYSGQSCTVPLPLPLVQEPQSKSGLGFPSLGSSLLIQTYCVPLRPCTACVSPLLGK